MNASRIPAEAREPRMEPLARLPVFLALDGKRAVVAGNGPGAAWKAELLSAAGAAVDVYAEQPCDEFLAITANPPRGAVVQHDPPWQAEDLPAPPIALAGLPPAPAHA